MQTFDFVKHINM